MICYINSNPTMQQAREGTSNVSSGIGMCGKAFQQRSKANSGTAAIESSELMAPIHTSFDTKKRPATKARME